MFWIIQQIQSLSRLPKPSAGQWAAQGAGELCTGGRPLLLSEPWLAIIQILEPFINKAHNRAGMRALLSDITRDKFWFEKLGPMTSSDQSEANIHVTWSVLTNQRPAANTVECEYQGMGIIASAVWNLYLSHVCELRGNFCSNFGTSGSVCSSFFHEQNEILNWTLRFDSSFKFKLQRNARVFFYPGQRRNFINSAELYFSSSGCRHKVFVRGSGYSRLAPASLENQMGWIIGTYFK